MSIRLRLVSLATQPPTGTVTCYGCYHTDRDSSLIVHRYQCASFTRWQDIISYNVLNLAFTSKKIKQKPDERMILIYARLSLVLKTPINSLQPAQAMPQSNGNFLSRLVKHYLLMVMVSQRCWRCS